MFSRTTWRGSKLCSRTKKTMGLTASIMGWEERLLTTTIRRCWSKWTRISTLQCRSKSKRSFLTCNNKTYHLRCRRCSIILCLHLKFNPFHPTTQTPLRPHSLSTWPTPPAPTTATSHPPKKHLAPQRAKQPPMPWKRCKTGSGSSKARISS